MKTNKDKTKDTELFSARDHSFKFVIGTLVCPDNSGTFAKNGMMVVIDHFSTIEDRIPEYGSGNYYTLYSQYEQREVKIKCWVVNSFWTSVSQNEP